MNLKDYAPYYIGCRCLNTWFPEGHKQYNLDWRLTAVDIDSVKPYRLDVKGGYTWTDSIKLTLRKLEDINNEEWIEIESETSVPPDAIGWYGIKDSIMTMETRHRFHWVITNEVLIILRKRGVDVDGLIDKGFAVDIKTLTK